MKTYNRFNTLERGYEVHYREGDIVEINSFADTEQESFIRARVNQIIVIRQDVSELVRLLEAGWKIEDTVQYDVLGDYIIKDKEIILYKDLTGTRIDIYAGKITEEEAARKLEEAQQLVTRFRSYKGFLLSK